VLVVDDDPVVGASVRRVLSREHDVELAHGGREALDRIAAGEPFDVVLCDVVMPGVSGLDVHAELSQTAPSLAARMVFMTGGALTTEARDFLSRLPPDRRLDKPFAVPAARAVVMAVVAQARQGAR
jgi:CheY-like chemotaxis protein